VAREWIEKNPARPLKLPKIEEMEVKPYTPKEFEAIMGAIEEYPNRGIYKMNTRARVRAFILTLRWTGMRIGDAIQLSRNKVSGGKITLRTEKNRKRVLIPMHPDLIEALKAVENDEFLFWSGSVICYFGLAPHDRAACTRFKVQSSRTSVPAYPSCGINLSWYPNRSSRCYSWEHPKRGRKDVRSVY
jgi:integrase